MKTLDRGSAAGFTLIEMLVVITIISILTGLSLYGVMKARKSGVETAAKAEVQMLCSRIDSFKNAAGYYPPGSLVALKVTGGNGINEGNESLFAFLLSRKNGGPFADDLKDDRWDNTDGDSLSPKDVKIVAEKLDWVRGTASLLEYVDLWGNPFVYIPSSEYGKKLKYQTLEGGVFEVEAGKSATTGTYYAPTTFQLYSLGSDGINQNGEGDDIVSWK